MTTSAVVLEFKLQLALLHLQGTVNRQQTACRLNSTCGNPMLVSILGLR